MNFEQLEKRDVARLKGFTCYYCEKRKDGDVFIDILLADGGLLIPYKAHLYCAYTAAKRW